MSLSVRTPLLTPLQRSNLDNAVALRDLCRTSPGEAAWVYAIEVDSIAFYANLSDEELLSVATEIDVALFVPRHTVSQLRTVLAGPREWRALCAAVLEQDARTPDASDPAFGEEVRRAKKQ